MPGDVTVLAERLVHEAVPEGPFAFAEPDQRALAQVADEVGRDQARQLHPAVFSVVGDLLLGHLANGEPAAPERSWSTPPSRDHSFTYHLASKRLV